MISSEVVHRMAAWVCHSAGKCCKQPLVCCRRAGQLRCLACAKVVPDYNVLAQHLRDKHGGSFSGAAEQLRAPGAGRTQGFTVSLADLIQTPATGQRCGVQRPGRPMQAPYS